MIGRPSGDQLVLAAQTLARSATFEQRVAAAASAGFHGMGLSPRHRREALAGGATDADLRGLLQRSGVSVVELEVLRDWGLGGEPSESARRAEDAVYETVDALGGEYVIAVGEIDDDLDVVARRFSAVCDRAAVHGLQVAIEFVPFTTIPDAATAWEIVRRSDRPNAGVLVDSWHHFRGAADPQQILTIPPDRIAAVQIDDADAEVRGSLLDDTLHHRRLPGRGSFDLEGFVRLLDEHGVSRPWSVEVISDEMHSLDAADTAQQAAAATVSLLRSARGRVDTRSPVDYLLDSKPEGEGR